MLPEEKARIIIDKQLTVAGWDIVSREEYIPLDNNVKMNYKRTIKYNGDSVCLFFNEHNVPKVGALVHSGTAADKRYTNDKKEYK